MEEVVIGIFGGSGLYEMEALKNIEEVQIDTPFGKTSDAIFIGEIDGVRVSFMARHGRSHTLLPSEVPYKANIFAMKKLGVRYLLSVSAVGSLREEMKPRDVVIPNQYIDHTKHRDSTFFGHGIVAHVSMAQPTCKHLNEILAKVTQPLVDDAKNGIDVHVDKTYICIEGPQFSSFAESNLFRLMGADIVGMTNMPEAKLAKETQIAYSALSMITDYDCWHPHEEAVNVDMAIANLKANSQLAQKIIQSAIRDISSKHPVCLAHSALKQAVVTPLECMTSEQKELMELFLK